MLRSEHTIVWSSCDPCERNRRTARSWGRSSSVFGTVAYGRAGRVTHSVLRDGFAMNVEYAALPLSGRSSEGTESAVSLRMGLRRRSPQRYSKSFHACMQSLKNHTDARHVMSRHTLFFYSRIRVTHATVKNETGCAGRSACATPQAIEISVE